MKYEVILDLGETANKCTVASLSCRNDFCLINVAKSKAVTLGPLRSDVLLHLEGECLSGLRDTLHRVSGIASIDCVWKRVPALLRRIEGDLPRLVSIPDGFVTAYPRKSAKDLDPARGLATIEAIFTASALLGHWDASLFSQYYFGRKFIDLNKERFLELGVSQVLDHDKQPTYTRCSKTSVQRRSMRGRMKVW